MFREWLQNNNLNYLKYNENITCCIYKIISPSNKIYVGSTVNLFNRLKAHSRYNFITKNKGCSKLYNSFKKYDIINHKVFIVEVIDNNKDLNDREIYYINLYNSFENGLNLTTGGRDHFNHSTKTKLFLRNLNLGKTVSKEVRLKMSLNRKNKPSNRKGVKLSNETKDKISNSKKLKNVKLSEEHRLKISLANKGKLQSEETRLKISLNNLNRKIDVISRIKRSKKFYMIDISTKKILKIYTKPELDIEGIYKYESVKRVLLKRSLTSQGFYWEYCNDYHKENENENKDIKTT